MLTRSDFESALKGALRHYTQTDLLTGNALLHARVLCRSGPDGNAPQKLRALLGKTADSLFANERDRKLYRVLDLTYFNPAPKQEAVAARLGLSLSTYRRYLTTGIDRLTEWLWRQEQESAQSETTADHSTERAFADPAMYQDGDVAEPRDVFQRGVAQLSELSTAPPLPISQPAVAPRLSIVVLPFTNLVSDPNQQYFADGITEDLTTDLSRVENMFVISRNTAFTYQGKRVDTKRVGRELRVRYVLEGSVRRSGNQVRVNAQLIEAESDTHLWAERFDGVMGDLFALQDDAVSRIAIALNRELTRAEGTRRTDSPDALDFILRGRAAMSRTPSRENRAEAMSLFKQALALDPDSLEAKGRLALMLAIRAMETWSDSIVADLARAEVLIGQVLAALPLDPLAHHAKGSVLRVQGRPEEAIAEFETVLAFDRNSTSALFQLGWCKAMTGALDEVIPLAERLIRLSPRDPQLANWYARIGWVHLLRSRFEEAILWLEKAHSANPRFLLPCAYLASAYALKGETERAPTLLAEARKLAGDGRYSSLARLKDSQYWGVPKIRALFEATYFAGLRKAGMPEE